MHKKPYPSHLLIGSFDPLTGTEVDICKKTLDIDTVHFLLIEHQGPALFTLTERRELIQAYGIPKEHIHIGDTEEKIALLTTHAENIFHVDAENPSRERYYTETEKYTITTLFHRLKIEKWVSKTLWMEVPKRQQRFSARVFRDIFMQKKMPDAYEKWFPRNIWDLILDLKGY